MERNTNKDDELKLPAALIEALKAENRPNALITARTDRALQNEAAAHFSARRSQKLRPVWYAAAAVAALALFVVVPGQRLTDGVMRNGAQNVVYADVDVSGRIDIADVLLVARSGKSSQAHIDAFASRIVSLSYAGDAR